LLVYTLLRRLAIWKPIPIKELKLGRTTLFQVGGAEMGIQDFSEDVILITLPVQPQQGNELEAANSMLSETVDHDVVVDFSEVKMLTSGTICSLMILDRLLRGSGRQLVLCNISSIIKQIFVRTGLLTVFEFADDELTALEQVRSRRVSWAGT
jgi:anti-anti-sigma regulatory factor